MNAIITGSSRGLGFDLAEKFVAEGMNVAITARNQEALIKCVEQLHTINPEADVLGHLVEFNDRKSIDAFVASVLEKWHTIDVLVNNAGIYNEDRASEDIDENLLHLLNNNMLSAVRTSHAIIQGMKLRRTGHVFNVVSISAKTPRLEAASYTISKIALKGYNDLMREELRPFGVKVTGVYPGAMSTSSWDGSTVNRAKLVQTSEVISAIMSAVKSSQNTLIEEIVINNLGDI